MTVLLQGEKMKTYYQLENLYKRCDSVYKLIIMASRRATEINDGMDKLVDARSTEKPTVTALREILADKVKIKIEKNGKSKN